MRTIMAAIIVGLSTLALMAWPADAPAAESLSNLQRAAVFLKAGDYRQWRLAGKKYERLPQPEVMCFLPMCTMRLTDILNI